MHWALLFVFVCMSHGLSAKTYDQITRISLDTKPMALTQIFRAIEKESEFLFNYLDSDVNHITTQVSIRNGTIHEILTQALKHTHLAYSVNDRHITIYKTQQSVRKTISGTVVDAAGEAVIGVNIRIKGTNAGVISDVDGHFVLEANPGDVLVCSFIGYNTQEITVGNSRRAERYVGRRHLGARRDCCGRIRHATQSEPYRSYLYGRCQEVGESSVHQRHPGAPRCTGGLCKPGRSATGSGWRRYPRERARYTQQQRPFGAGRRH